MLYIRGEFSVNFAITSNQTVNSALIQSSFPRAKAPQKDGRNWDLICMRCLAWKPCCFEFFCLIPCLSYQRWTYFRQNLLLLELFEGNFEMQSVVLTVLDPRHVLVSLTCRLMFYCFFWILKRLKRFYMPLENVDSKSLIKVSVLLIRKNMRHMNIMWWYWNTITLMADFWFSYTCIEGNFWCICGS